MKCFKFVLIKIELFLGTFFIFVLAEILLLLSTTVVKQVILFCTQDRCEPFVATFGKENAPTVSGANAVGNL